MENIKESQVQSKMRNTMYDVERELGPSLPVSFLTLMLSIPMDEPIQVTKLRGLSTLGESGVSRALSMMAQHRTDKGRKVPKFLTMYDDPIDRRHRLVQLNDNGRRFLSGIVSRFMPEF